MPVDRGRIDQQLREIGEGERWWEVREFRELPHALMPDEQIRALARGKVLAGRRLRMKPSPRWLLVATDQRILCIKQDRFARRQIEIPLGTLTRVREQGRLRTVQITLDAGPRRLRLRIHRDEALRFTGALHDLAPKPAVLALPPDLEPLTWIPGFTTVASLPGVAGIVSKVSMLSPPSPPPLPAGRLEAMEKRLVDLEAEVDRLQQQVGFLEELLEKRTGETLVRVEAR